MSDLNYGHHLMAKEVTDYVMDNWRNGIWTNKVVSSEVSAATSRSSFPSPDRTLYDAKNKRFIGFEFKPPSETKRGMLTSLGQILGYSDFCHLSYLISPEFVEGFKIGDYLQGLFVKNFKGRFPFGLIQYPNDCVNKAIIRCDIDVTTISLKASKPKDDTSRFWAKHQDMPPQGLYYLLDCAYQEKETGLHRKDLIWKSFWNTYYWNNLKGRRTLRPTAPTIFWGYKTDPIIPGDKFKERLLKDIKNKKLSYSKALDLLWRWSDPDLKGDTYSNSVRKNFVTFIKHLKLFDDCWNLTPSGFDLHKTGKLYGPSSRIFVDALKKEVLFTGHHLDLIIDLNNFCKSREYTFKDSNEMWSSFIDYYNRKGMIKWNVKRRKKEGQNQQFRYEAILWRKLNFLGRTADPKSPQFKGLFFNWDEITRVCALQGV